MELAKNLVRQRDMYKLLLTQSNPNIHHLNDNNVSTQEVQAPSTPVTASSAVSGSVEEYAKALKELQQEYDTYRAEKSLSEKKLEDELDALKQELSKHKFDLSKAQYQLDFEKGTLHLYSDVTNSCTHREIQSIGAQHRGTEARDGCIDPHEQSVCKSARAAREADE
jgi:hypothetical protein